MWGVNIFVLGFIGMIIADNRKTGSGPTEGLVGAHAIAIQWEAFSFMPGFALGTACGNHRGSVSRSGECPDGSKGHHHLHDHRHDLHGRSRCLLHVFRASTDQRGLRSTGPA